MADFNATKVTARFTVGGGIAGPDELAWLKEQGVTHVINAAAELDDGMFHDDALTLLHIDWHDDGAQKPLSDFLAALHFVEASDSASSDRLPVYYVHCHNGHNRGPLLLTFLLAALVGLPAEVAYATIKAARPVVTALDVPHYRQSVVQALEAVCPFRNYAETGASANAAADPGAVSAEEATDEQPDSAAAADSAAGADEVSVSKKRGA